MSRVRSPHTNGIVERLHRTSSTSTSASKAGAPGSRPSRRCRRFSTPTSTATITAGRTRAAACTAAPLPRPSPKACPSFQPRRQTTPRHPTPRRPPDPAPPADLSADYPLCTLIASTGLAALVRVRPMPAPRRYRRKAASPNIRPPNAVTFARCGPGRQAS